MFDQTIGKLYVVATPIGNLEDISFRAVKTLKSVDLIACEDTRVSKKLLEHYQINKKLVSYHQHSSEAKNNYLVQQLKKGLQIALVCDAGTPGISDPGIKLVAEAVKQDIKVIPIPGAATIASVLSISGFPCQKFLFLGFMPHKKGRRKFIEQIISSDCPVMFFDSKHRIKKLLNQLKEYTELHQRQILIARELTKLHETLYRGTIDKITIPEKEIKGEFAIIIN